jgi:hypothetical protein
VEHFRQAIVLGQSQPDIRAEGGHLGHRSIVAASTREYKNYPERRI